jgi:hypothetical protein
VDLDAVSYATKLVRLDFPKHQFRDMEPEFQQVTGAPCALFVSKMCWDIVSPRAAVLSVATNSGGKKKT